MVPLPASEEDRASLNLIKKDMNNIDKRAQFNYNKG